MEMKIEDLIKDYVKSYSRLKSVKTTWKEPLIAYADTRDELFLKYKEIIGTTHKTPEELLEGANTVITYFLPFQEQIVKSNIGGRESSNEWAIAYVETNQLIFDLNNYIKEELGKVGYRAAVNTSAQRFNPYNLKSDWSQRHIAYAAGLGKFGLNNMLITEKGCCGRIGTIVTDYRIEPTKREEGEYCLYKSKGICKKCVEHCVNEALLENNFNRVKCYEICMVNAERNKILGEADTCGKCLAGMPCSFHNPNKGANERGNI